MRTDGTLSSPQERFLQEKVSAVIERGWFSLRWWAVWVLMSVCGAQIATGSSTPEHAPYGEAIF